MKILPINTAGYNYNKNLNFKSSIPVNQNSYDSFDNGENDNNDNNSNQRKPLPEWARKAMIFTVVFFAFKNDPTVQNLLYSNEPSEDEKTRNEFFEDVQKMRKEDGKSSSFYHLNRLYDIEQPEIKTLGDNRYSLEFNLDNQKIQLEMKLNKKNKDTISGRIKTGENQKFVNYKAIFSPDSIEEFKILLNDGEEKFLIGRDTNGELYKIKNHKKEILNNENVEKYEQYLENLETYDDLRFFTNENSLWRKLNYILLIFILYNEYQHDKNRRKQKNNTDDNPSQD